MIQALDVRRRALNLPEPPGPRGGLIGSGPRLRLLIAGDSAGAGVGATHQERALSGQLGDRLGERFSVEWRLEATTGHTTRDTIAALAALPASRFDVAVLSLGVNDVTRLTSPRRWRHRQTALHAMLRERFGVQVIIASGLPPMGQFPLLPQPLRWVLGAQARRLDAALAALAAMSTDVEHVSLNLPFDPVYVAHDGFHPSEAAYSVWAEMLARRISAAVASRAS